VVLATLAEAGRMDELEFQCISLAPACTESTVPKDRWGGFTLMKIWVNNAVREDLIWATEHIQKSFGIRLFSCITWDPVDADAIVFCDVSLQGLAFWYPARAMAYYAPVPTGTASDIIFYFEALAVAGACDDLKKMVPDSAKIIIYTDSMNTMDIFNSLRCLPEFNTLFMPLC
jgi:hypothetical protein